MPSIAAGYVVAGRYKLQKRLGEGGMGEVWVADDEKLRSQVALKLLHNAAPPASSKTAKFTPESDDSLKRFLREAQAAARLRSPHVVQIIEHGVDQGVPFIAMELLEGESLAQRLARLSTLSLAQTARIVTHVSRAIGKAHEIGIIHRDLKPDNVFLVHNDDEEIAKVLDFGIAKVEAHLADPNAKVSTQEGSLLGTPLYMSPEQVRGHGVDARSDLWSLAMIAFECVCGRLPFDGRTVGDILVSICSDPLPVPSTLRPLPASFDAWFAKAATRDPAGRFQSAKEMSDALRAIVGEDSRTPQPSLTSADSGPVQRVSADAITVNADSIKELESAKTISAGGSRSGAEGADASGGLGGKRPPSDASTIGGASAAIAAPEKKRTGLFIGIPVALAAAVAVALAFINPKGTKTVAEHAAVPSATAQPPPPPVVASVSAAPPVVTASASVAVVSSASAAPSASHAPAKAGKHPGVVKNDELAF